MGNESSLVQASRNLKSRIPGAARSLGSDWSPKILVPLLVVQVSVIAVLSLRIFSSDMSGKTELAIVIPALIPLITWVIASAIRGSPTHRHLVSRFPQTSAFFFLSGLVLITIFLTLNEETLFVPAYYLFLLSTSIILLAVSESMDDSGFDWVELIDALIGGARSKSEMVLAMVPVTDEGKLSFRGSSELGRSNVTPKRLGTGVLAIERRTQYLGYLVRNKEKWNPVTVHGLSILGRGFSVGAARVVEEQSLCSLLLIALHDPKDRWDKCNPQNLLSGDGDQKIELESSGLIRIKHRWTEEELSNTAFTIAKSISGAIGKQEVSSHPDPSEQEFPEVEAGGRSRKNPFDINEDGRVDFEDLVALWGKLDVNEDGEVNILDVLYLIGWGKKEKTKEDSFNEMLKLILGLDGDSTKEIDMVKDYWGFLNKAAKRPMQQFALSFDKILIDSKAIRENATGAKILGEEKTSVINRHLTVGYLVSLSSLASMNKDSLSEIAWKEHITFFTLLAKKLFDAVDKEDEEKAEEHTGEFFDFDDFLGRTTANMIDRVDVVPHGIEPAELLEKRKGTVMASALLLEILSRYLKIFKDEG